MFRTGIPEPPVPPIVPFVWGLPPCCAPGPAAECENLAGQGVQTEAVSYAAAAFVWCVYEGQLGLAAAAAVAMIGPLTGSGSVFRPNATLPSWFAGWNADQAVVAIAGVETDLQLLAATLSLTGGPVPQGGFSSDVYSALAAGVILGEMVAAGLPLDVPIVFAGHSSGGAVGSFLVARERQLRPARLVRQISFGEPRSGNAAMAAILTEDVKARWDARGDIVPFCPPDVSAYAAILGIVPALVAGRWALFRPSGRGRRLNPDGTTGPSLASDASAADILHLVTQWFLSLPLGPLTGHGISNYTLSLKAAVTLAAELPDPRCLDLGTIDSIVSQLSTLEVDAGLAVGLEVFEVPSLLFDAGLALAATVNTALTVEAGLALAVRQIPVVESDAGLALGSQNTDVYSADSSLAIAGDLVNLEVVDAGFTVGLDVVGVKTLG